VGFRDPDLGSQYRYCEAPPGVRDDLRLRYGTNRTTDVSANASAEGEKLELSLFVNRYSSAGYSLGSATDNLTVAPFSSYTAQSRLCYQLDPHTTLSLSARYFTEGQKSTRLRPAKLVVRCWAV
jgi:outer membrane receptor for ferrienterochelin and colicins